MRLYLFSMTRAVVVGDVVRFIDDKKSNHKEESNEMAGETGMDSRPCKSDQGKGESYTV